MSQTPSLDTGTKYSVLGLAISIIFMGILSKFDITFDDAFQGAVAVVATFLFGWLSPARDENPPSSGEFPPVGD